MQGVPGLLANILSFELLFEPEALLHIEASEAPFKKGKGKLLLGRRIWRPHAGTPTQADFASPNLGEFLGENEVLLSLWLNPKFTSVSLFEHGSPISSE